MREFKAFPKIPRLNRDIIITEKIDGTNAAIRIELPEALDKPLSAGAGVKVGDFIVRAQSRTRFIQPLNDNAGFAKWVWENAAELTALLGEGIHFGEWWGAGVQRRYAQATKRFSLFNVSRWGFLNEPEYVATQGRKVVGGGPVDAVQTLYRGPWFQDEPTTGRQWAPEAALDLLRTNGSVAAPGFTDSEGIMVFHEAGGYLFKATVKDDEKPKGVK